ncbi:zinc finger protein 181-like isoform X2 [Microplitis mediator]|uniref:zinc finger protein 181-like isoform X2 n=1 Tax=Microplitis mediator TaxID=375433 RepID=UPI002556E546|nr:zinc finger protein 181-like isoform X2 [Microplitis mediator]
MTQRRIVNPVSKSAGADSNKRSNSFFIEDETMDDNHHYYLMQELSDVLGSCNPSVERQSDIRTSNTDSVSQVADKSFIPGLNNNFYENSNALNRIEILKVESLNESEESWMESKDDSTEEITFVPVNDNKNNLTDEIEFKRSFMNIKVTEDDSGNSSGSIDSESNPDACSWDKFPIDQHELNILRKYLPFVQLRNFLLPDSSSESSNDSVGLADHELEQNPPQIDIPNNLESEFIESRVLEMKKEFKFDQELDIQEPLNYECEQCRKSFKSEDLLKYHVKYRHRGKSYECAECEFATSSKPSLIQHMRIHSNIRPYKCPYCLYASSVSANTKNHIMNMHMNKRPLKCTECEYTSIYSGKLRAHKIKKHFRDPSSSTNALQIENYACGYCNYKAVTTRHINYHMRTCHSDVKKKFKSSKCPVSQNHHNNSFGFPAQDYGGKKKYKCDVCMAKFKTLRGIDNHKSNYHSINPFSKTLNCQFCQDTFTNVHNLKLHTNTHKKVNFHKCTECLYTTTLVTRLEKHMTSHVNNKLFVCNDCSKAFKLKKILKQHRKNFH